MPMSFFLIYMLIIWHFKAFEKTHSEMEHPVCLFDKDHTQIGGARDEEDRVLEVEEATMD